MSPPCQILLFGDQTQASRADLKNLLHVEDHVLLKDFLQRTSQALRSEISKLPAHQQASFPRFTTLLELLSRIRESGTNQALDLALLCTCQLAHFIRYYGEGSRQYPDSSNSYTIGLCTGSFAAAAISTSQTIPELLPAAVEALLVAFRTGLRSMTARNDIEPQGSPSQIWSVVVELDEKRAQEVVDNFSTAKGLKAISRPYVSASASPHVTISAPSLVLDQLLESESMPARPMKLPIYAPYHAPHIYDCDDVDYILGSCDHDILESYSSKIPLISCSTGDRVAVSDYRSLLRTVTKDVLTEQLRWEKVLQFFGRELGDQEPSSNVEIYPILTYAAQSLASALSRSNRPPETTIYAEVDARQKTRLLQDHNAKRSKVAIVGYSGRFPDANSADKLWELLNQGLDVHREIPKDRFDVETHYDPTGKTKNTSRVKYGCFINEPGLFDARFFNMSPRESANADPGQRLALTTAYEALEMSGLVPDRTPSTQKNRVGIFYGMTSDDWREVNSGQNVDTYFIPGGNRAFTPGRINYHFKFSGPSISVDTACSSSFAALHTACNSLWNGDCDTAVAGGTNVMTNPDNFAGLDRGHFLSTTGNCKTFDQGADGYCRADAVGTVVLKRLEDALADKDPIKGVIVGAYTNHSAEAESMTRPHSGAQAFIFDKVLNAANVDPLDISYIEMHGTGTQAGDAMEMQSVLEVFAKNKRGAEHPLHLGSVKANLGHAESASGVTSLIKVLKMMEHSEIPPHPGIKSEINRGFPKDLKERNVNIALESTPWTRPEGGLRKAFLNNFSAAGGNTALLLEDAPPVRDMDQSDGRSSHLVAVSAKGRVSLQQNIEALLGFLDENASSTLPSLAYTTTARRMHHSHRVIVNAQEIEGVKSALKKFGSCEDVKPIPIPSKVPNVKFVFTGQGALYAGIARQFFEKISSFRADLERFDHIAQSHEFPSFLPLIDGTLSSIEEAGPVVSQLGTACVQMALARLWSAWGIDPSAVIGHSVGEYAALYTASVLSASDTIFLVGTRAQLLVKHCTENTHSMLAVKASLQALGTHINGSNCEVACINDPSETVLSGPTADIGKLSAQLESHDIKFTKLEVPFAFHSSQVESILQDFESAAEAVSFNKPSVPYISPLLQQVVKDEETLNVSYLSRACRETVNFEGALTAAKHAELIEDGDLWLEIGAHPICSKMVQKTLGPQTSTLSTLRRNDDVWKVLADTLSSLYLSGIEIQWSEYHRDFKECQNVLGLPSYRWDSKNYWIQYENDFCLTKGDYDERLNERTWETNMVTTSAVQKVLEQQFGSDTSTVVIESDLNHPKLSPAVQGHMVNGAALCPSSLYADIAMTISNHLLQNSGIDARDIGMNVSDMTVEKPLIATKDGQKLFRASASADWNTRRTAIEFYSVNAQGKKTTSHASCIVKFEATGPWLKNWSRDSYLIRSRVDCLEQGVNQQLNHKLHRGLVYKLFGALVDYAPSYQGMEEVILDSAKLEATAKVKFQTTPEEENHYISPFWVDSLGHLAGFVMNASDCVDSKSQVFVNHGWDSMRCSTRFSRENTYTNYVRMQHIGDTTYAGDTYIFDGEELVALYQGVQFKGVPRSVLDNLLPGAKQPKTSPKASAERGSTAPEKPKQSNAMSKNAASKEPSKAIAEPEPVESKSPDILSKVLEVIADEVGIDQSALGPGSDFADLGIDSLLSLNISSRLREELELDVENELLLNCTTVQGLQENLAAKGLLSQSSPSSSRSSSSDEGVEKDLATETSLESDNTSISTSDETDIMDNIRRTVAEEVGINQAEINDNMDLAELGIDSLLALNILSKLREDLDKDFSPTLFADHANLREIEAALGLQSNDSVPQASQEKPAAVTTEKSKPSDIPPASSMLLQGNNKAAKKLFLFPDGSGSATSYLTLPRVSPDIAVYGLNCPYMKHPEDMSCGIDDITPSYLEEIRRRQPTGPYFFGGWSAGGICAFDAAQELDRQGEKVERLILIDTPFPIGLEKLPPRLYDFFKTVGLFGSGDKEPPSWLLPHFLAFVDSLDKYRATPFDKDRAPRASLIWARDGVCKYPDSPRPEPRDDDPKEMTWLLENRTDFGPNGWDSLLDGENIHVEDMSDANHFSMMEGENATRLAEFIKNAMD